MKRLLQRTTAVLLVLCFAAVPARALTVPQAIELLEEKYIDDLPPAAYDAQTLNELISAIGDKYTEYMTAEEYEVFLSTFNDKQTIGIGVSIQEHAQGVLISSVLDDTPAQDAGLVPGDVITSVNGTQVTGSTHAASLLAGEIGTPVTITILRANGEVHDLTLIRREFSVNTTAVYSPSLDGNAGVITCTSFGDRTSNHIYYAVRDNDESVNAWIVDVRNNPGGSASTSAGSAGVFAGGGTMVYLRDGQDDYQYIFTHPSLQPLTEKNTIILTNPNSSSGAELFTAAMRDHGAGIAVGQRTFGKGVAQVILSEETHPDLFDGDALKLTAYRFFSPVGTTHDRGGVLPTLLVAPQYAPTIALLLSAPEPESAAGHLNISLSGFEFFIQLDTALSPGYRASFLELLEALPPTAQLWTDRGNGNFIRTELSDVLAATGLADEYQSRSFSDLSGSPSKTAIDTLAAYKLVSGYGDGQFRPELSVSRAEFCAMIANALGFRPERSDNAVFYDVPADAWYFNPIMSLYERGFVSGYSDGGFSPAQTISSDEAVSILAKVAAWLSMRAHNAQQTLPAADALGDYNTFPVWVRQSAYLLEKTGVDLSDLPEGRLTRAGAAELLFRLLTATNVLWPMVSE